MTETETETIAVAEASDGSEARSGADPGEAVSLPVVEILTGRGFITGKSGSGKSNTASVVIESLLSNNFPVLIVDTDGEYYGLKEAFEILHVGADEECDIRVGPEHAEKIASLALEQNVPIILDVSSYLDEAEANELLRRTARRLFAKEKKLKKPFLMLVEECHEYMPEGGGLDETGKMLIKIGKRGRKHGLGIVGISQRPADVKKDYITQCDWLVWHRLTWRNDTSVVGRILGSEYADAIEEMGDGEGFLMTDWSESIRRVQFHRKETFDAGATPGLDDFERPELKSVSGDLVSELRDISDEKERRESELADLRQELERKERRIAELENELEEARDLRRMADQFSQALLQRAEAPYRGGEGRNLARPAEAATAETERRADRPADGPEETLDEWTAGSADAPGGESESDDGTRKASGDVHRTSSDEPTRAEGSGDGETSKASRAAGAAGSDDADGGDGYPGFDGDDEDENGDADATATTADGPSPIDGAPAAAASGAGPADGDGGGEGRGGPSADGASLPAAVERLDVSEDSMRFADGVELGTRAAVVEELTARIDRLDDTARGMLRHYRVEGSADPVDAHAAAGGDGDRRVAYSHNRALRRSDLVRHAGRGTYAYAVPDLIEEAYDGRFDGDDLAETVAAVEERFAESESESAAVEIARDGGRS